MLPVTLWWSGGWPFSFFNAASRLQRLLCPPRSLKKFGQPLHHRWTKPFIGMKSGSCILLFFLYFKARCSSFTVIAIRHHHIVSLVVCWFLISNWHYKFSYHLLFFWTFFVNRCPSLYSIDGALLPARPCNFWPDCTFASWYHWNLSPDHDQFSPSYLSLPFF